MSIGYQPPTDQQLERWLITDKYQGHTPEPAQLVADLARLHEGEPLAYVIGWVNFLGLKIDLSCKTLIPRPETEYWVGEVMKEAGPTLLATDSHPVRMLDLCCGSGCIGLALWKHLSASQPQLSIDFVDNDPRAIQQTKLNIELNQLPAAQLHVRLGNLFEGGSGEYDLIVTNPPYVPISGEVGPETVHEPQHAIFAQKDGLELIYQIILKGQKFLKKAGKLYLEFGEGQGLRIAQLAKEAGWASCEIRVDQFGVERWAVLERA